LALAVNALKANATIRISPTGALVGHTSIAATLWFQPGVAAGVTHIAASELVSAYVRVVVKAAVEWHWADWSGRWRWLRCGLDGSVNSIFNLTGKGLKHIVAIIKRISASNTEVDITVGQVVHRTG
jgi:hypothetical protein